MVLSPQDRPAARARYEADGVYLHPDPIIPADLLVRASAGMDALTRGEYETGIPPEPSFWNPGDDPNKLIKIEIPQACNRAILALVSHPALGELAHALTDAAMVQVWWVQLLIKAPAQTNRVGAQVGWHQDRQYWSQWEEGSELFTAWVAVSDVPEEAGPVRYVRGSHRWGLLGQGDFFAQDLQNQRIAAPAGQRWEEVAGLLPPGGVSFHHQLTVHGSSENRGTFPRRSFAIHLRTERSRPVNNVREGLAALIDDPQRCPVIYGDRSADRARIGG